jgi:FtsH-binding integral membrane protein
MDHQRKRTFWSLGIGVLLLLAGALMLTNNLGFTDIESVWNFWPVIIIATGIGQWMDAETSEDRRKAFFWLFIGAWFLCSTLHLFGLSFHNSWPIVLIGIGISTIWRSLPGANSSCPSPEANHAN